MTLIFSILVYDCDHHILFVFGNLSASNNVNSVYQCIATLSVDTSVTTILYQQSVKDAQCRHFGNYNFVPTKCQRQDVITGQSVNYLDEVKTAKYYTRKRQENPE